MSNRSRALGGRLLAAIAFTSACGPGSDPQTQTQTQAQTQDPAATREASVEVLRAALEEPDPYARAIELATLLPTLGRELVPEVREILAGPEWQYGGTELELLVRYWAEYEPEAASIWAFAGTPSGYAANSVVPAFERWAMEDPEAVVQYVYQTLLMAGPNTQLASMALVRGWQASGQPGLEDFIQDMGISFERQRAVATMVRHKIRRESPEAAVRWAEAIGEEDERFKLAAIRQVGAELAKVDPAAAVAWCEAHCEGPYGPNLASQIATPWAARDGMATMEWLSTLPAGKERDLAVRDAFRTWRRNDEEGLVAWITDMGIDGVEPHFRAAVGRYAMMIARESPEEALEWAALMEDEQKRNLAFLSIARRWRETDEAAAEAWLEQSPLNERQREKARNPAPMVATPPGKRKAAESPQP